MLLYRLEETGSVLAPTNVCQSDSWNLRDAVWNVQEKKFDCTADQKIIMLFASFQLRECTLHLLLVSAAKAAYNLHVSQGSEFINSSAVMQCYIVFLVFFPSLRLFIYISHFISVETLLDLFIYFQIMIKIHSFSLSSHKKQNFLRLLILTSWFSQCKLNVWHD